MIFIYQVESGFESTLIAAADDSARDVVDRYCAQRTAAAQRAGLATRYLFIVESVNLIDIVKLEAEVHRLEGGANQKS